MTAGLPSPEIFRKWCAISTIAAALERRVWTDTAMSPVYPNLYVLLVAPPGVGKSQAIKQAAQLWALTKKLKVAPDDVTRASLLDHLARSLQVFQQTPIDPNVMPLMYHSMQIAADEFGVFVQAHDTSFLSVMNKLFDNGDQYLESRRGREDDLVIVNPQVNMLAGTQPDFLAHLLPPEAWGMGFMSRMLMVYAGKSPKPKLFGKKVKVDQKDLIHDLKLICELYGEMQWTPAGVAALEHWYDQDLEPVPEHSKLKHYVPRRILTTLKLSIISCASRMDGEMMIDAVDVERAKDWLLEIEGLMPEIFKDMSGQGDSLVIQDLHAYVWELYIRAGKKSVHIAKIMTFLSARTPSYNAENILRMCVRSGILNEDKDVPGDFYIPGPHSSLRLE